MKIRESANKFCTTTRLVILRAQYIVVLIHFYGKLQLPFEPIYFHLFFLRQKDSNSRPYLIVAIVGNVALTSVEKSLVKRAMFILFLEKTFSANAFKLKTGFELGPLMLILVQMLEICK